MDYSVCRDIPMRLDINHQPLNFDIYLSQEIDVPRTTLEERPYDFQLEVGALKTVDTILERIKSELLLKEPHKSDSSSVINQDVTCYQSSSTPLIPSTSSSLPPPSCPNETLLTPIKSSSLEQSITTNDTQSNNGQTVNQVNPRDFEDIHYNNPFDHLELQTIDELRELDLVFQASYAADKPKEQK